MNRLRFFLVSLGAGISALGGRFLESVQGALAGEVTPGIRVAVIEWKEISGATGYEIRKDGRLIANTGRNTLSYRVPVGVQTKIEVTDLPRHSLVQEIDLMQTEG